MFSTHHHYRTLQVQPDAPVDVIRHNYRILLKKLRMHPDLGGSGEDAILLNAAYEALSISEKRAAYDQLLFKEYDMATLSLGHLKYLTLFPRIRRPSATPYKGRNRRNYYRLLQIHPEAHALIIQERYRYSLERSDLPHALLHEAHAVLGNPQKRAEYDRLLKRYQHAVAVEKMEAADAGKKKCIEVFCSTDPDIRNGSSTSYDKSGSSIDRSPLNQAPIDLKLLVCCAFCNASRVSDHSARNTECAYGELCLVCRSPLFSAMEDVPGKTRRTIPRLKNPEIIMLYRNWPGQEFSGHLCDISPQGLRFTSKDTFDTGQIIKIDGKKFKAVGEVVHCQTQGGRTSYGVRFRTVQFSQVKGKFLFAAV